MSREREVVEVATTATAPDVPLVESREQKKARFASVLDRGIVGDRLRVDLPDGLYGEWVPNDQMEVFRMETLGFKIDTEYARKRVLHSKGDAASYVGDCVYMTCPKENKEIIDEIRTEQYQRLNGPKSKQKEERDYSKQAETLQEVGIRPMVESSINAARKTDLEAALGVKD